MLVEVYKDEAAPAKHKETAHYAAWRDAVADMMAVPRSASKYCNVFPAESSGWDVPAALAAGSTESGKDDLLAVHVFVSVKPGTEDAFKAASLDNAQNSVQVLATMAYRCWMALSGPRLAARAGSPQERLSLSLGPVSLLPRPVATFVRSVCCSPVER